MPRSARSVTCVLAAAPRTRCGLPQGSPRVPSCSSATHRRRVEADSSSASSSRRTRVPRRITPWVRAAGRLAGGSTGAVGSSVRARFVGAALRCAASPSLASCKGCASEQAPCSPGSRLAPFTHAPQRRQAAAQRGRCPPGAIRHRDAGAARKPASSSGSWLAPCHQVGLPKADTVRQPPPACAYGHGPPP